MVLVHHKAPGPNLEHPARSVHFETLDGLVVAIAHEAHVVHWNVLATNKVRLVRERVLNVILFRDRNPPRIVSVHVRDFAPSIWVNLVDRSRVVHGQEFFLCSRNILSTLVREQLECWQHERSFWVLRKFGQILNCLLIAVHVGDKVYICSQNVLRASISDCCVAQGIDRVQTLASGDKMKINAIHHWLADKIVVFKIVGVDDSRNRSCPTPQKGLEHFNAVGCKLGCP
mmetsp:Transcript_18872/g.44231  ORF Transcript_18872/g.44231 Transcript_18872/m.44231 type:complete len:229 (+) Transcript_18872:515-1201(+)